MIAPKQESTDLVMQWLKRDVSAPEAKITTKGDYVTIEASVRTIEKLLDAEYNVFGMFLSKIKSSFFGLSYSREDSTTRNAGEDAPDPRVQSANGSQGPCGHGSTDYLLRSQATAVYHLRAPCD